MHWDVIIVGAGPAGSVAAADLARAGARTLVLDCAAFPRDKACGDALPPAGIKLLRELGIQLPVAVAERLFFVSPRGRSLVMSRIPGMEAGLIRRATLDDALLYAAIERGAVHRTSAVLGLLRGPRGEVCGVQSGHGPEHAPVVLGADGATLIVARSLGVPRPPPPCRSVAIRGYVETPGAGSGDLYLHFFADDQPAYGWCFPCGDGRANIGVFLYNPPAPRRSTVTTLFAPVG